MYRVKSCGIPAGGPCFTLLAHAPWADRGGSRGETGRSWLRKGGDQGAPAEFYECCRGAGLAIKIPAAWLEGEVYVMAGRKGQLAVGRAT